MRSVIFSLAVVLLVGLAKGASHGHPLMGYKEGQRFFLFPDSNGKMHLVDSQQKVESRFTAEQDTNLLLYTRKNPKVAQKIIFGDSNSLAGSNFDKSKDVKFIAHGWTDNGNTGTYSATLRDAFLNALDVNVVVYDWGVGAAGLYPAAVLNVSPAGVFLAKAVDWFVSQGTPIANVCLVGHSLGSHVVGIAGRSVTRGKVPNIMGLDPAMPLWGSTSQRLRSTDGAYVEVIHTNGGNLGLNEPCGDNDFYPNRGSSQPGCAFADFGCNHARSWLFYAESLDITGYKAKQCTNYDEMNNKKCANLSDSYMGGSKVKPAKGIFYLETAADQPWYLG